MNKLLISAAVLVFAATNAAALDELNHMSSIFARGDYLQHMVRPYRDRAVRFSSARLDALQMRVAIGDEADQLTLENWGDNRAAIRGGANSAKAEYANLAGSLRFDGEKAAELPGHILGAYAHYGGLEAEASRFIRREIQTDGEPGTRQTVNTAAAAYSFGGEKLRLGVHGNYNLAHYNGDMFEYVNLYMRNHTLGAAAALRAGPLDLGLTADYLDRSACSTFDDRCNWSPEKGNMLGAQTIVNPDGAVKLGLRYSSARFSSTSDFSGAERTGSDHTEFGARAEWNLETLPLTVAASYENAVLGDKDRDMITMKNRLQTAGAALRPFGGRLLLGAEVRQFTEQFREGAPADPFMEYSIRYTAYTGGAEVWLLPGLAVRGSYQRQRMTVDDFKIWFNITAVGAGLKLGNSSLDAAYSRNDLNNGQSGSYDEGKLTYSYLF